MIPVRDAEMPDTTRANDKQIFFRYFLLPSEALEVNGPSWQGMGYGGGGWDGAKFCEISNLEAREAWLPRLLWSLSSNSRSQLTYEVI